MNQLSSLGSSTVTLPASSQPPKTPPPILYLRFRLKNPEAAPVVISTPPPETLSRRVMDEAFNSLGFIVDCYRAQRDVLSIKLIDWILEFLIYVQLTKKFDDESVKTVVKMVNALSTEILISDLDQAPLEEPVLVDGLVWENWMLEDYKKCCPQLSLEVRIHRFAMEVIKWRNTLPIAQVSSTTFITDPDYQPLQAVLPANTNGFLDRKLCTENNSGVARALKIFTYCKLIRTAHSIQKLRAEREQAIEGVEELRELWEQARINIAAQAEEAEREANAHTEKLVQSLNSIAQSHAETVSHLNGLIGELRVQQQELKDRIQRDENTMCLQEGQIWKMRVQIANQWEAIRSLQKKAHRKKRLI